MPRHVRIEFGGALQQDAGVACVRQIGSAGATRRHVEAMGQEMPKDSTRSDPMGWLGTTSEYFPALSASARESAPSAARILMCPIWRLGVDRPGDRATEAWTSRSSANSPRSKRPKAIRM